MATPLGRRERPSMSSRAPFCEVWLTQSRRPVRALPGRQDGSVVAAAVVVGGVGPATERIFCGLDALAQIGVRRVHKFRHHAAPIPATGLDRFDGSLDSLPPAPGFPHCTRILFSGVDIRGSMPVAHYLQLSLR